MREDPRGWSAGWRHVLLRGRLTVLTWLLGAALTGWILWGPFVHFAYRSPRGHLVLDTVDTCVALLAAYLAHGRFVRSARLGDLLLAQALLVLGLANGLGGLIAQPLAGGPGTTDVWLPLTMRSAGAALLLGAALVSPERLTRARESWSLVGPLLVLAAAFVASWLLGPALPIAMDTAYFGDPAHPRLLTAHPVLITAYLIGAVCFLVASLAYTRRGLRTRDELLGWLGAACALGGFARVNYALSPSLYTDWLYAGDVLRTGFYLLLLVGSARELSFYWHNRTLEAVEEDRRRLARELHDGLVQELTYIRGEAHGIDDPGLRDHVVGATDRAVDEARAAIHALGHLGSEPLPTMLEHTARELGRRHGMTVEVDADPAVDVAPDQSHTVLRIVREAVTNAARHGRAGCVRIEVGHDEDGRVLRVRDDGSGFDPRSAARSSAGYGIISMGERARALPGTLEIDSEVGRGSEVRLRW